MTSNNWVFLNTSTKLTILQEHSLNISLQCRQQMAEVSKRTQNSQGSVRMRHDQAQISHTGCCSVLVQAT